MADIILFDLDGTLTDPKEGITRSVRYGIESLGYPAPELDALTPFIGPPLLDMFMEFCGFTEEEAKKAVAKYRERFRKTGIFENEIYEGMEQMLGTLRNAGKRLGVATSKPWEFAETILSHFRIRDYFESVTGSEMDGTRVRKGEVIEEALRRFGVRESDRPSVLMVGDRKHDVIGARENRIACVGVTYGYGGREELEKAGADEIVDTIEELTQTLLR